MPNDILFLVIFALLFFITVIMYNFGDKILIKLQKKKGKSTKQDKPKKPKIKPTIKNPEEPKISRPTLLSPGPQKPVEEEVKKPARAIPDDEFDEIKKFIENVPSVSRQGLSDYDKIEEFGDVIDIDDYESSITATNPYEFGRPKKDGESEFLKNRGEEKNLYEELKNMSPEMKKIIMADILKRKIDN